MRWLTLSALVTLGLDQLSKLWVVHLLDLKSREQIDVLAPLLTFRMAWNQGVNFGLGASGSDLARWGLVLLALAIAAGLVLWARREGFSPRAQVFAGLVVGGAVGNVIDRVAYGAVADFLNMSCCGIHNPWSFNIADVGVFLGAVGLVLFSGKEKTPQ